MLQRLSEKKMDPHDVSWMEHDEEMEAIPKVKNVNIRQRPKPRNQDTDALGLDGAMASRLPFMTLNFCTEACYRVQHSGKAVHRLAMQRNSGLLTRANHVMVQLLVQLEGQQLLDMRKQRQKQRQELLRARDRPEKVCRLRSQSRQPRAHYQSLVVTLGRFNYYWLLVDYPVQ